MRTAATVAFLAHVAGFAAIVTYPIGIAVLNFICHAAAGAVLKHTRFFTALIADAVSVMLLAALLTIFIRVRPLLNLAAIL